MSSDVQLAGKFLYAGTALLTALNAKGVEVVGQGFVVAHLIDTQNGSLHTLVLGIAQKGVVAITHAAGDIAAAQLLAVHYHGALLGKRDGNVLRLILGESDDELSLTNLLGQVVERSNLQC